MWWLEVEYRASASVDDASPRWRSLTRRMADSALDRIEIGGLDAGDYDVRARYYDDEEESYSEWAVKAGITAGVDPTPPPAPAEIRQTAGGCLSWRMPAYSPTGAGRIAGYGLRHAPAPHRSGDQMEPAHEGLVAASPWPLCELPGGDRSVAVRAVNERGVPSVWTYVDVKVRELDDRAAHVLSTTDHGAAGFSGALVGGTNMGASLVADAIGGGDTSPFWTAEALPFWHADPGAPLWTSDEATFWDPLLGTASPFWSGDDTAAFWAPLYATLDYMFTVHVEQLAQVLSARLTVNVDVGVVNAPWRLMYRRPGGDVGFWQDSDTAAFWTSDTEPFWRGSDATPWRPWPGRLEGVVPGEYRFRLIVPGGRKQGTILGASSTVSVGTREEFFEAVAIPQGGVRVKPSTPFLGLLSADVAPRDTTPSGVRVDVAEKDRTRGAWLVATDGSGTPSTAVCDVTLKGY